MIAKTTLAALAAAALLAVGCGDDDDSDSITKDEFTQQASEICQDSDAEIEEQAGPFFGGRQPSAEEQNRFVLEIVIPSVEESIERIDELPVPEGDEDAVQRIVDAAREGVEQGKDDPSLLAGEGSAPPALNEAERLAGEYGITGCAG